MFQQQSLISAYEQSLEQHAMVSKTDASGRLTYVNKYFCSFSGYTESELIGKDPSFLYSKLHSEGGFQKIFSDLKAGSSWRGTLKNRAKDGNFFWVDIVVTPILCSDHNIQGYLCIQYDVSSQKQTAEKIKTSEAQLKQAQKIARIGSWTFDFSDNSIHWSDQMFEIFSRNKKEGVPSANEHYEAIHIEDKGLWSQTVTECIERGGFYSTQFRVVKNQEVIWLQVQGSTKKNSKGELELILGTCQDITNQVSANEELVGMRNLLKSILDFMPGPVYSKDKSGIYLFVNRAFIESVNMKVSDPIGKNDHEIYDKKTADDLRANDLIVAERRELQEKKEKVPHPDGSIREYESYKFPTFDQSNNISSITGISFDVTEKNKMKSELELERSRLIQASKMTSLGEMAGGIAHEVNNPLAIIEGYTKRLQSEVFGVESQRAQKIQKISNEILKAVDRTGEIILGLRNFARDASNEKFKTVLVANIIQETYSLCRSRFSECDVSLLQEVDSTLELECQEVQISQVLLNLLGNALDATIASKNEDGLGRVKISATNSRLNEEAAVSFKVEDYGHGFGAESIERFLEPFYSTKEAGKGTGLGLSISKGLIEKHGGELRVSSQANPTVVEVILPMYQKLRRNQ